ncbi:MAG: hypothetical protein ABSA45_02590 [Verrucomicrobiota bacterium]|jgi:hypothetical protein
MNKSILKMAGLAAVLALGLTQDVPATENVPHAPFAEWADLPQPGQLVAGLVYQESEAYHIWANGGQRSDIDFIKSGEHYGIDINQGYVALQYGISSRWALDLNIGYTTSGWRSFSNDNNTPGDVKSTTGLMDYSFGVRYQIFNEVTDTNSPWIPTLTFRAGAVLPGTYSEDLPFGPGVRSAAIEPELLAKKHFGWPGFGAYGDVLYRWNRTTANDQVIASVGFLQQIKGWELDAGYRHLQTLGGYNLSYDPNTRMLTTSDPNDNTRGFAELREINDSVEAGFSYTTSKRHIKYAFYTRTVFNGNNSDQKFWIGGGISMPFQIFKRD